MSQLALPWILEHATYGLMFALLIGAGLGLPVPEDVVLLAGGALIHRGATHLVATAAVCVAGVLAGDLLIFLIARHLGPRALDRPLFRRLLPEERRQRLERAFARWGGGIVFGARHVAGIRAPVFALAGLHGMNPLVFVLWDLAGLAISAPVVMGLGYLFSDRLDAALQDVTRAEHWAVFAATAAVAVYATYAVVRRNWSGRRQKREP